VTIFIPRAKDPEGSPDKREASKTYQDIVLPLSDILSLWKYQLSLCASNNSPTSLILSARA
jgi:hypothetical protein